MDFLFSPAAKARRRSTFFFLKQYFRHPFGIGAVAPSSQKLARLIVKMLAPAASDVVVELGPGTGVFTRELLSQGIQADNLISIEFNAEFVKFLRREFPTVRIVEGAAQDLPHILQALGQGPVRKVISGIPLRSMKPAMRDQIAAAVGEALEPGGVFVQFSYFKDSPLPKAVALQAGMTGRCVGTVMTNVPPAFVWQYVKKS